jgi:pseudouridine-5'-phosphate glycosidase
VKDGVFKAGLHPDELEDLAKSGEEGRAIKCSTRDLPLVASRYYRRIHDKTNLNSASTAHENTAWGGQFLRQVDK